MKIVFVCGSLESGKDGVGDYTRRLAGELIRQGSEISIIALYDQFVLNPEEIIQFSDGKKIPILRLPSSLPNKKRHDLAKHYINKKNPSWLSLQFVIFSFHPKGLPLWLANHLYSLGQGRLWHIMFHELWVGMPDHATRKQVYWGKVQSLIIKTLIKKLQPLIIHTQSRLYIAQLKGIGFQAQHLPLFSNIPVIAKEQSHKLIADRSTVLLLVFGTIHPETYVREFIRELQLFEKATNKQTIVQLLGKNGKEQKNWIILFKAAGLALEILGEQPAEVISEVLSKASLGISTSAPVVIEKSGTVAAMLEHGLPILCIAKPWVPKGINILIDIDGVYPFYTGCIEQCLQLKKANTYTIGIENISKRFAESLEYRENLLQ